VAERSGFFKEWVRAPLVTASIVPSSRFLSRAMARGVNPDTKCVIELGPGTGVITRCLLDHGVAEESLVLVEINHFFANQLRKKFPRARVIHGSAERLQDLHFEHLPEAAVSGIPFMSMTNARVRAILESVFSCMAPGGKYIQFTYAPRCPVNRELRGQLKLDHELFELVLRNIPPASVYHIWKSG